MLSKISQASRDAVIKTPQASRDAVIKTSQRREEHPAGAQRQGQQDLLSPWRQQRLLSPWLVEQVRKSSRSDRFFAVHEDQIRPASSTSLWNCLRFRKSHPRMPKNGLPHPSKWYGAEDQESPCPSKRYHASQGGPGPTPTMRTSAHPRRRSDGEGLPWTFFERGDRRARTTKKEGSGLDTGGLDVLSEVGWTPSRTFYRTPASHGQRLAAIPEEGAICDDLRGKQGPARRVRASVW